MPGTEISDILSERRPPIEVDSTGGRLSPFPHSRRTQIGPGSGKASAPKLQETGYHPPHDN